MMHLKQVLYYLTIPLLITLILPIESWFGFTNWNTRMTFFVLPFIGLSTLPMAIYTKNVRQILYSVLLILGYFVLVALSITFDAYNQLIF